MLAKKRLQKESAQSPVSQVLLQLFGSMARVTAVTIIRQVKEKERKSDRQRTGRNKEVTD